MRVRHSLAAHSRHGGGIRSMDRPVPSGEKLLRVLCKPSDKFAAPWRACMRHGVPLDRQLFPIPPDGRIGRLAGAPLAFESFQAVGVGSAAHRHGEDVLGSEGNQRTTRARVPNITQLFRESDPERGIAEREQDLSREFSNLRRKSA